MKNISTIKKISIFALLSLASLSFSATTVVKIGKRTITKEHVDSLVQVVVSQQFKGQTLQAEQKQQLLQIVAGNLIGQELLDLEADAQKVQATPTELDSLYKEFRASFPDSATFKKTLKAMGIAPNQVKTKMSKEIRIAKVLRTKLKPLARPTEADIKSFYSKNSALFGKSDTLRASQIFMPIPDRATPTQIEEINGKMLKMREKLSEEKETEVLLEAFSRLAYKYSQSPDAKIGGDLGRFKKGDFFPDFNKNVATLQVGQMTKVFRSPQGFHLVLLTEKHDGTLENAKLRILHYLINQQTMENQQKLAEVFDSLSKKYKVEILNPAYGGQPRAESRPGDVFGK